MQRLISKRCPINTPLLVFIFCRHNTMVMYIQGLYPILVHSEGVLQVVSNKPTNLTVKVLDQEGRIAKTLKTIVDEGKQDLLLNLADLISGSYVLNAFSGDVFLRSIRFHKE